MNGSQIDNAQTNGEVVDGFSDTDSETKIGSPDPGNESKVKPLTPEEYAKAQKEARTEDDGK